MIVYFLICYFVVGLGIFGFGLVYYVRETKKKKYSFWQLQARTLVVVLSPMTWPLMFLLAFIWRKSQMKRTAFEMGNCLITTLESGNECRCVVIRKNREVRALRPIDDKVRTLTYRPKDGDVIIAVEAVVPGVSYVYRLGQSELLESIPTTTKEALEKALGANSKALRDFILYRPA